MTRHETTDVLVVGGGMAGLCAAIEALERGKDVLVIEKGNRFGGSMRLSGGLIWTFADKDQLKVEIPDGNDLLQHMVVEGLWDSLSWLEGHGVELSDERTFQWYGRGRHADPAQLSDCLVERVKTLGGRTLLSTGLHSLRVADGAVTGAEAFDLDGPVEIEARAVILTTGGFQGNPELLARYVTPYADSLYLRGNPWSTGDGFLAATQAGAAATPWLDTFYGHALAGPPARFTRYEFLDVTQRYGPFAVALNLNGERFVDESAGTGEEALNLAIGRQPRATAAYIVDDAIANDGVPPPRVAIERARDHGAPVLQADTLEALAEGLAAWTIPPPSALQSLRGYNVAIESGDLRSLVPGRARNATPIVKPPFTAVLVRAGITFTCGGLQTDLEMRVLRRSGTVSTLPLVTADFAEMQFAPIPNLYAAGCDIGGVSNRGYMGGLATALITGRTAGATAATS